MRIFNFTIVKFTLCLIAGILLGFFFKFSIHLILTVSGLLIITLFVLIKLGNRKFFNQIWFGLLTFFIVTMLGVLTVTIHDQRNYKNHYLKEEAIKNYAVVQLSFRIGEVLKSGNFFDKYIVDVLNINGKKVSGQALLNVDKGSLITILNVDDIILTKTQFKALNPPLNPYQFDYKNYLKKKGIYHQLFLTHHDLFVVNNKKHTLFGYASGVRKFINTKLKQYAFKPNELAIINALLLGQRQDISPEIYNNYTQAGVIHILAVSGLHVGIILLILNRLFKPIELIKHGSIIKTILLIVVLWAFAIIAGLSASVVRAVFMFMIVAIAINLKRPANIYNTIAISIFFLLLIKPGFLFDVGFQLSYIAVFSIVTFHPLLYKLWKPKWKSLDFFWNLIAVTIAAQIGITPISLYYFHQFPGLFFISNLVIIPVLGIILGMGMLILFLASINFLPQILATIFGKVINLMNSFVAWVANKEAFLFKNISFGLEQVIVCYLLIFAVLYVYTKKSFRSIVILLFAILVCQGIFITKQVKSSHSFTVFHKSRKSIIGHSQKNKLLLFTELNDSTVLSEKLVTNYVVGHNIKTIKLDTLKHIFKFDHKTLLVVDSLGIYKVRSFSPNIVLLRNSPRVNLERLIETLQPQLIISDGSNYKSYQERWKITCDQKNIPFHQTDKKGAFKWNY